MEDSAQVGRPIEIWRHWQTLTDGLHAQRASLCASDWIERLTVDSPVIMDVTVSARSLVPVVPAPRASARPAFRGAGLDTYADIPMTMSTLVPEPAADGILREVPSELAAELLGTVPASQTTADVVTAATSLAVWWVAFFAIVRDTGVHHFLLTPDLQPLPTADTVQACRAVGLGLAIRALGGHLWARPADASAARVVYARAISLAVQMEPGMPALVDRLGELRLVDLVTTTMPWRGQFVKYAGGTGAGQVE